MVVRKIVCNKHPQLPASLIPSHDCRFKKALKGIVFVVSVNQ